ncbi:unnamed protein product [Linum trigynum]|uniref:Reverse transcriptase zinc-binding domain-containing protein n=1 Tax=Linum trigynum TaxID=586398 RepID=A0AAV2DH36_9ROSI
MANRCELCKVEEETVDHLFIHCAFSKEVWRSSQLICSNIDLSSIDTSSSISRWSSDMPGSMDGWVNYCALHAIFWQVWLERNRMILHNKQRTSTAITLKAVKLMMEWPIVMGKISREEGRQWINSVQLPPM